MNRELYKKSVDKNERQELRRRKLLQEQKLRRLEQQDEQRCLRKDSCRKTRYRQGTFQELYGGDISLQFSEWMRERPEDFNEWLLVPCPKGQRCLVVAAHGQTKMFSKTGRFRMAFKSFLPGGDGGGGDGQGGGFCILDCVYNADVDSFFVLDVLWYGKQCFLDCEAQFRFFWLKSKFAELEDKTVQKQENLKKFYLLNSCRIENEAATASALQIYPLWPNNSPELDGFLFYHNEAGYSCGPTPLVCWLFPFMVEDVLNMTVNSLYERPPNYSNPWLYMDDFDKELARKRQRRQTKQMDCANDTDSLSSSALSLSHTDKEIDGFVDEPTADDNDGGVSELHTGGDRECSSLSSEMRATRQLELEGTTMY